MKPRKTIGKLRLEIFFDAYYVGRNLLNELNLSGVEIVQTIKRFLSRKLVILVLM